MKKPKRGTCWSGRSCSRDRRRALQLRVPGDRAQASGKIGIAKGRLRSQTSTATSASTSPTCCSRPTCDRPTCVRRASSATARRWSPIPTRIIEQRSRGRIYYEIYDLKPAEDGKTHTGSKYPGPANQAGTERRREDPRLRHERGQRLLPDPIFLARAGLFGLEVASASPTRGSTSRRGAETTAAGGERDLHAQREEVPARRVPGVRHRQGLRERLDRDALGAVRRQLMRRPPHRGRRTAFAALAALLGLGVLARRRRGRGPLPCRRSKAIPLLFPPPQALHAALRGAGAAELGEAPGEFRIVALGDSMSWGWRHAPRGRLAGAPRVAAASDRAADASPLTRRQRRAPELEHDPGAASSSAPRIDELAPGCRRARLLPERHRAAAGAAPREDMDQARRRRTPGARCSRWLHARSAALPDDLGAARERAARGARRWRLPRDLRRDGPYWRACMRRAERTIQRPAPERTSRSWSRSSRCSTRPAAPATALRAFHQQVERACAESGIELRRPPARVRRRTTCARSRSSRSGTATPTRSRSG